MTPKSFDDPRLAHLDGFRVEVDPDRERADVILDRPPLNVVSRTTGLVTPCMVRSPISLKCPVSTGSARFDTKVIVGYFCTSKKFALRRSLSRF